MKNNLIKINKDDLKDPVIYAKGLCKYLPNILLLTAINLFIAVETNLLADTYLTAVAFITVNAIFLLAIQLTKCINLGTDSHDYLWRDASRRLPKDATYVKVVVKHKGSLHMVDAFYSRNLYGKYQGWGLPLSFLDRNNEVVLWRYSTFEELEEY